MNNLPAEGGLWNKIVDRITSQKVIADILVMMLGLGSMRLGATLNGDQWVRLTFLAVGVVVTAAGVYGYVSCRRRGE